MNMLIDGAIGVEVILQKEITSYKLPFSEICKDKQLVMVSFCNSNDVPQTPSGKATLMIGTEKLTLRLADKNTKERKEYSIADVERNPEQLTFGQIVDFEHSELILTNVDNPEYYAERAVYLVFWFGKSVNKTASEKTEILPVEVTLDGNKTLLSTNNLLVYNNMSQLVLSFPGFTPSGKDGLDRSSISNKFVSLSDGNSLVFSQIPLYFFFLSHATNQLLINNLSLDCEKSYLESLTTKEDDLKTLFFNLVSVS